MYGTWRISFLLLILVVARCGQEFPLNNRTTTTQTTPTTTTTTTTTTAVSFTKTVKPILMARCYNCHSGDVGTYADLMSSGIVVAGKPTSSTLYTEVQSGGMPRTGSKLTSTQITSIYNWIKQGAKNN